MINHKAIRALTKHIFHFPFLFSLLALLFSFLFQNDPFEQSLFLIYTILRISFHCVQFSALALFYSQSVVATNLSYCSVWRAQERKHVSLFSIFCVLLFFGCNCVLEQICASREFFIIFCFLFFAIDASKPILWLISIHSVFT